MSDPEIDTDHTAEPICPYCGNETADEFQLHNDEACVKCEECGEEFSVVRFLDVTYCTYKQD